ncbi:uncharacterized protein K441DRAFT_537346 [Cenococcum geophilum 1.58]|uniref:uncharacterized protein n=1 Tax=Cenococcum geophilum 1.58 TaxID=794803 RepID=UPI00358E1812|nr:hypothetical protein K441DRAFT_537346 [Cenococcum geophilum 1.58]
MPLLVAAERGHKVIVKLLLIKDSISLNSTNIKDLLWAVRDRHKLVVRLLIRSGLSSLNLKDFSYKLLYAVRFRQTAVVQLLLESVNINYK